MTGEKLEAALKHLRELSAAPNRFRVRIPADERDSDLVLLAGFKEQAERIVALELELAQRPRSYGDDVALCGPDTPKAEKIDDLLRYCLTVRKRFGNTAVTFSLKWGSSALWARDSQGQELEKLRAERDEALSTLEGMDVLLDPARKLESDNERLRRVEQATRDWLEREWKALSKSGSAHGHRAASMTVLEADLVQASMEPAATKEERDE